jgi:hypothetical protein
MPTGTDDQATHDEHPEEPAQGREDRSSRAKVVKASAQVAAAVTVSAIGQLAGEALARILGL